MRQVSTLVLPLPAPAGPRQNQHGSVYMLHRSLLLRIQICKSIHQSSKNSMKNKNL